MRLYSASPNFLQWLWAVLWKLPQYTLCVYHFDMLAASTSGLKKKNFVGLAIPVDFSLLDLMEEFTDQFVFHDGRESTEWLQW